MIRGERKKGSVYEGGHRVCAIFDWPEQIKQGRVFTQPLMIMNLLPTLVEMAGRKVSAEKESDRVSVSPHLRDGSDIKQRVLFWQDGKAAAIRDGDWKLIKSKDSSTELYHLKSDLVGRSPVISNQEG